MPRRSPLIVCLLFSFLHGACIVELGSQPPEGLPLLHDIRKWPVKTVSSLCTATSEWKAGSAPTLLHEKPLLPADVQVESQVPPAHVVSLLYHVHSRHVRYLKVL